MTTPKRRRGRPIGSSKDDDPTLMKAAHILLQNPGMKPTTAMNRVIHARKDCSEIESTLRRRLQQKWRASGQTLLDRARQELAPKAPTLPEVFASIEMGLRRFAGSPQFVQTLTNLDSAINRMAKSPELARAIEAMSAWDRKLKEAAAASPLFDMNKMALLEKSMKKYVHPTWPMDDAVRRYVGLLGTPSSRAG